MGKRGIHEDLEGKSNKNRGGRQKRASSGRSRSGPGQVVPLHKEGTRRKVRSKAARYEEVGKRGAEDRLGRKRDLVEELGADNEEKEYETVNKIFSHLFSKTLWDNAKQDMELFDDIFVNREKEIREFESFASPLLGGSILFLGRRGVGKSAVIYKLSKILEKSELFKDESRKVYTLLLDLENEKTDDALGLIKHGAEMFVEYIDKVAPNRFHELNEIKTMPAIEGVHAIARALTTLLKDKGEEMPYIFYFVDDLDYALDTWYDLVMGLAPITALPFISPVYAARPLLESTMFSCEDLRVQRIINGAEQIRLRTLPVRRLITYRVLEIVRKTDKTRWRRFAVRWGFKPSRLWRLLENIGLRENGEFKYPFSKKMEVFLEKSTNGDARLILDMVKTCLQYIVKNRRVFKPNAKGFFPFEKDIKMGCFGRYKRYPIVNLNPKRFRSYHKGATKKTGFPLLYNVIEWIGRCEGSDEKVADAFERLGHTKEAIEKGIKECLKLELIGPIVEETKKGKRELSIHNYVLTPKGEFHLSDLITWGEYREKFGDFKGGIAREFYKKLPMNAMYTDIMEFLLYIVTAIREIKPNASEMDISLTTLIDWYVEYQTTYLRASLQELYSPDNPDSEYMIDEDKLDYLLDKPPVDLGLGKNPIVKGKYEAHKKKRPKLWRRRMSIADIEATAVKLEIGKQSKLSTKDRCDFKYFLELAKQIRTDVDKQ